MRIGFVINQYPPYITSGLGRYVEAIAPHLAPATDLRVFTLNDGNQPVRQQDGAVRVHRPVGRLFAAIARRRRLNRTRRFDFLLLTLNVLTNNCRYVWQMRRRKDRPDLVAVHDSTNFLCGLLCHHLLRLPVVFHVHTTEYGIAPERDSTGGSRVLGALERWLGRVARRVVVATPEVRDQLVRAGWNPDTIDVVWLGGTFERMLASGEVDPRRLPAEAKAVRERLGIAADDPVLLFVGRLERQKGIYQLLAAMPRIAAAVPGLRLVVLGEGDHAGLTGIVAESGLDGQVIAPGEFVTGPELLAHYAMADACVFPSLFEPFGLVATEAMALARPTILGDGFSRIFLDHPDRPAVAFVRSTDPDDIAGTIIEVMTDPALRAALGERGERFVRERLSWVRAAEQTLEIYRSVLAKIRA